MWAWVPNLQVHFCRWAVGSPTPTLEERLRWVWCSALATPWGYQSEHWRRKRSRRTRLRGYLHFNSVMSMPVITLRCSQMDLWGLAPATRKGCEFKLMGTQKYKQIRTRQNWC